MRPLKVTIGICLGILLFGSTLSHAEPKTLHHDLRVTLSPPEHRLSGVDTLTVEPGPASRVEFVLSESASVRSVRMNGRPVPFEFKAGRLSISLTDHDWREMLTLVIRYEAVFDDPAPVAPLNMDNPGFGVNGTLSERGVFLQGGAGWYPEIPGSHPTYRLRVEAPQGILAVSPGRGLGHETREGRTISTWEVTYPLEGLSLSAARYHVREKQAGRIRAMTYFFPESDALAPAYLDAVARYLALYEALFGPYPFDKFAVVENFFPTGYGFPSYTLLGSRVLRLPFIIRTSLGHEIAHCWWGNSVYVGPEGGNWCEGLTTYVADYLFKERASAREALEYRRQVLRNFATLVRPEKDFPLSRFQGRTSPASQVIGYGKAAMVFHMVRKRIGDTAFWGALRDVARARRFQETDWRDWQVAFERRHGAPLQAFFDQWLSRTGAPCLSLERVHSEKTLDGWRVRGEIRQTRPLYDLDLNLALAAGGKMETRKIRVSNERTPFELTARAPPRTLTADPAYDLFRGLYRTEIPPSINALKASASLLIVLPEGGRDALARTVRTLTRSLGLRKYKIVSEGDLQDRELSGHDLIFLGLPPDRFLGRLPANVQLTETRFALNGRTYANPSDCFFGVFEHPGGDGRVMAVFLPLSPEASQEVARKATHYGKYSYLAFTQGRNRDKGFWPVSDAPLTFRWNQPFGREKEGAGS
jgi:hypothetical protein